METQTKNTTAILEIAWKKYGQFDIASGKRSKSYMDLRKWIAFLGVMATLFAILTALYPQKFPVLGGLILKVLLVASPLLASVLAAYGNKFYASGDWLITRAGAEEVLKEIYFYRTILTAAETRRDWLENRIQEIQRAVYRGMNGELVMDAYVGITPPPPRFQSPNTDPGFHDLNGDEYYKYRLEDQLNWHIKNVNDKQRERIRLQVLILASGSAGALLAALGGGFTLWVALTASLTTTIIGWQELRNLDLVIRNYSKVRLELGIIADHWKALDTEEQTQTEFFKMVRATEEVLWSRNVEYIKSMQEALKDATLEDEASLINRLIQEQRDSDHRVKHSMEEEMIKQAGAFMRESEKTLRDEFKDALSALAKEASSELVQAELASMREAIQETMGEAVEQISLWSSIEAVEEEFVNIDAGHDTPPSVLNAILSRYPKTTEAKG